MGDVLDDAASRRAAAAVQRAMALVSAAGGCWLRAGRCVSGSLGKTQRVYSAPGSLVGLAFLDPVDGGEDDEVVRAVEVDPEQAARGAEVEDAAGDGDVAVVVGEDFVGDGEVVERGVGERAVAAVDGVAPEGLRRGEELLEERTEARVLDEVVLAAVLVGGVGGVLPEPLDVFALRLLLVGLVCGEAGRGDWAARASS